MKRAAIINAIGKYSKIILSLIVNAILGRIISVEDHGIVAVITVFSTFFNTFSDMGFGVAIVQNKNLSKQEIDDIFSFTVYVSFALMLMFCFFSIPISMFYNNSIYKTLGCLLSISLFFNSLNMVPNGILNREKKFISIAMRTFLVYFLSSVISIYFAFVGFRYYALVFQTIFSSILQFIWNYATTKPKFSIKYKYSSVKKVINYSGFQFAFNIVNYFSRNLDNLLTGKFLGSTELAYYNKAYTLMLYPVNNLTGVVTPVLHPMLSDYQSDKLIIYRKYMKIVKAFALLSIFVSPVCYLGSKELILIMLGNKWDKSIECFRILSIAIVPQMINSSAGGIFQSIGNTKLLFINSCINTGLTVLAIIVGVFFGKSIIFLSLCISIAYIFHFISATIMLIKYGFQLPLLPFFFELKQEIIVSLFMIIGIVTYHFSLPNVFFSLIVKTVWLGVFFCLGLLFTKETRFLLSILRDKDEEVK